MPLDVDLKKVIQVAKQAGDTITEQDLIHTQYVELDKFWTVVMANSIIARRSIERIQIQISGVRASMNHFGYYWTFSKLTTWIHQDTKIFKRKLMTMLTPVDVENSGPPLGTNQPVSTHLFSKNCLK